MIFFTGLVCGALLGAAGYRYLCRERYKDSEVLCNEQERDKQIQKQLERLIAYGNDR